MSTVLAFQPSTTSPFTFQFTLNGVPYIATITWNIFGERYYLNLTDLAGVLVLSRALVSSGPRFGASVTWANGSAIVTTAANHNVPIGWAANMRVSQTGTSFDGNYQALSTGRQTLIYPLQIRPQAPLPQSGVVSFDVNLVDGVTDSKGNFLGSFLLYHCDTQQFEFEDPPAGS
jgi:hypothetical protein